MVGKSIGQGRLGFYYICPSQSPLSILLSYPLRYSLDQSGIPPIPVDLTAPQGEFDASNF